MSKMKFENVHYDRASLAVLTQMIAVALLSTFLLKLYYARRKVVALRDRGLVR